MSQCTATDRSGQRCLKPKGHSGAHKTAPMRPGGKDFLYWRR